MDFRFSSDERELIDQAGRSLRKHLPAERLVAGTSTVAGWCAVAGEGWLHAGLPEALGGGDLPLAVMAGIAREAGATLAGDAFVDNAVILPRLVVEEARTEWCEQLASKPGFVMSAPDALGERDTYGAESGLFAYRLADGKAERFAADLWNLRPHGGFGLGTGTVSLVEGAEPEVVFTGSSDLHDTFRDASILHAAALIGAGDAAMSDTIEYVKNRVQFGGPIGRFQAVKHALAEVSVGLEVAWNAVLYAALERTDDSVSVAVLQAGRAADQSTRTMVQLFGGIAMTWEHHAHWYVKSIQASRKRFGSTTERALHLARLLSEGSVA